MHICTLVFLLLFDSLKVMEIWKDVKNYEGYYQVSDLGNVRSLDHIGSDGHRYKGKLLNPKGDKLGYKRVHVSKKGVDDWLLVHRLVAEAFITKPSEECDVVNHLDNNPSNNRADNLEWTTYKGNMQWAAAQGRMKYNPQNLKKAQESLRRAVIAIDKNGNRYYFESQAEAAKTLKVSHSHIAQACRKDYGYKTVGGYTWEYAKEKCI